MLEPIKGGEALSVQCNPATTVGGYTSSSSSSKAYTAGRTGATVQRLIASNSQNLRMTSYTRSLSTTTTTSRKLTNAILEKLHQQYQHLPNIYAKTLVTIKLQRGITSYYYSFIPSINPEYVYSEPENNC